MICKLPLAVAAPTCSEQAQSCDDVIYGGADGDLSDVVKPGAPDRSGPSPDAKGVET